MVCDGRTDGPTDGRTDIPSYRDAWTHLKKDTQSGRDWVNHSSITTNYTKDDALQCLGDGKKRSTLFPKRSGPQTTQLIATHYTLCKRENFRWQSNKECDWYLARSNMNLLNRSWNRSIYTWFKMFGDKWKSRRFVTWGSSIINYQWSKKCTTAVWKCRV